MGGGRQSEAGQTSLSWSSEGEDRHGANSGNCAGGWEDLKLGGGSGRHFPGEATVNLRPEG